MFLIYILVMPVFYTADVFASMNADIHGIDYVSGFRRAASDFTIINVSAEIAGENINAAQLKLISDPTIPFDCSYTNTSKVANCEIRIPGDLPPGPHLYEIALFRQNLVTEAEPKIPLVVYADNLPPTIHSFSLAREGDDVSASFMISDRACENCAQEICSGISRIEFFLDDVTAGVFAENRSCLVIDSKNLSIEKTSGTGNKTICIEAYDALNQRTAKCQEIMMDFSDPKLINATIMRGRSVVKYTKGEPMGGISIQAYFFDESGLNLSTLSADFSMLNSRREYTEVYRKIDDTTAGPLGIDVKCEKLNENISRGMYNCTWSGLLVLLPPDVNPQVWFYVKDNLGNVMNSSFTLPIVYDKIKPVITAFKSGIADEIGRYWVGAGNNSIYVDINESGSGFYEKRLFVDFSAFGPQKFAGNNVTLVPNKCALGWRCNFDWINVVSPHNSGDIISISAVGLSSDDAGNLVEGKTVSGFYYDDSAPQILSITNSTVCPTAPNPLEITVNVSERYSGGVKAFVSAPNLSTSVFPIEVDCEESDTRGIWVCDIVIDSLVTFYVDGEINLTLEDRAGNSNWAILHQEVCEAAPGVPPNVVQSTGTGVPDPLDKIIAGYIAYPAFAELNLQYSDPPNRVQDVKITSCVASGASISEAYVVTPYEFKNPVIGFKISLDPTTVAEMTTLEVNCSLGLIIRSGTKVYQTPEKEDVTIPFGLKGTIFGGLNQSMLDALKNIDDEINNTQREIDDFKTTIDVLGTICTIAETLAMIVTLLQTIKVALYIALGIIYAAVSWTPWSEAAMSFLSQIYYYYCMASDYITTGVTLLAWQLDSNPVTAYDSLGFYLKLICGIFTCRLSEVNNFVEMFAKSGSADGGTYLWNQGGRTKSGAPNTAQSGILSAIPGANVVGFVIDYDWSSYRSKKVASHTLCLPGYVYNLKKQKQLLCLKKECYKAYVSAGFSPHLCDELYKVHECLYVESAAIRMINPNMAEVFFQGLNEWLMTLIQGALISLALYAAGCGYPSGFTKASAQFELDGIQCGTEQPQSALRIAYFSVICGAIMAVGMWLDVGDWIKMDEILDFNRYDEDLSDPDYCAGA